MGTVAAVAVVAVAVPPLPSYMSNPLKLSLDLHTSSMRHRLIALSRPSPPPLLPYPPIPPLDAVLRSAPHAAHVSRNEDKDDKGMVTLIRVQDRHVHDPLRTPAPPYTPTSTSRLRLPDIEGRGRPQMISATATAAPRSPSSAGTLSVNQIDLQATQDRARGCDR